MKENKRTLVSIVVPVYNVEKYVSRCIESIFNQTYGNYDLVLIDDGSTDRSGELCDLYKNKLTSSGVRCEVIHQKNGGLSAARNIGIEWAFCHSDSEWITFIDSDDWVHPEYLCALEKAAEQTKADVVIGGYEIINTVPEQYPHLDAFTVRAVSPDKYWVENRTNATVAWGKLYKKECFRMLRYPVGRYHEDEYVTYKILFNCNQVAIVDESLYEYYYNSDSISRIDYIKRLPDIKEALLGHCAFFKDSPWENVYKMEVQKYASALSDAVWFIWSKPEKKNEKEELELQKELKVWLHEKKEWIPLKEKKDVYIAAYPRYKMAIRLFGWIEQQVDKLGK